MMVNNKFTQTAPLSERGREKERLRVREIWQMTSKSINEFEWNESGRSHYVFEEEVVGVNLSQNFPKGFSMYKGLNEVNVL